VTEPVLLAPTVLAGIDVGLSASASADLGRLGLAERHVELALGELTRAILVAGGRITYGGRIQEPTYTPVVIDEVRRYASRRPALTVCLALPEHRVLSADHLEQLRRSSGVAIDLQCLDQHGEPIDPLADRGVAPEPVTDPATCQAAYSALRRHLTSRTDGRVLVGGQLAGFQGAMPGVVEEAISAIEAGQPLYVAGGFGGAAAAVARTLGLDDLTWAPADLPRFDPVDTRVTGALDRLAVAARNHGWPAVGNGLDEHENHQLAASHRPGEIASLVALGLARHSAS